MGYEDRRGEGSDAARRNELCHDDGVFALGHDARAQAGAVLGTAAYMSPEQARGKTVDKHADIWAFGVVLYEMIAGKRPFEGETVSDVVAKVIASDPNFEILPDPPRSIVEKCLRKDPRHRWRDIGDVAMALDESPPAALPPRAPQDSAKA